MDERNPGTSPETTDDDRDLRAAFEAMRAEDRVTTPEWSAMIPEAGRAGGGRTTRSSPLRWVVLAAASVTLAFFAYDRWLSQDAQLDRLAAQYAESPLGGAWRAPSDAIFDLSAPEDSESGLPAFEVGHWASVLSDAVEELKKLDDTGTQS